MAVGRNRHAAAVEVVQANHAVDVRISAADRVRMIFTIAIHYALATQHAGGNAEQTSGSRRRRTALRQVAFEGIKPLQRMEAVPVRRVASGSGV